MSMSGPKFLHHSCITIQSLLYHKIHFCIIFRVCFTIQGSGSVGGKSKRKGFVCCAMNIRIYSKRSGQLLPERMGKTMGNWNKQQKNLFCFHLCHCPVTILSARHFAVFVSFFTFSPFACPVN